MPSANTAMTNADGSAKTNAAGAWVVTDSSGGGCGPTLPCCDGLLLCAPPNVLPGGVNVQTVRFDYMQEVTGQTTTEQHNSAQVDIGCGTFFYTDVTPPSPWTVNRSETMANFPSSPGLKQWVRLGFGRGAEHVLIYWRPEAIWWVYQGFTPANPGIPGFNFVSAVSVSPCGRSATLEATLISGAITVRTTYVMTIDGSLLPCPSSADSGCSDCGDEGLSPA